jgi:hypothetical protein
MGCRSGGGTFCSQELGRAQEEEIGRSICGFLKRKKKQERRRKGWIEA